MKAVARYLNVDLEIRSRADLMPLVEALERRRLFVLFAERVRGVFHASFEVSGKTLSPDAAIMRLSKEVAGLSPALRRLWSQALDRVFDIGIEQTSGREPFVLGLRGDTVKIVARLNARVAVTVYPTME